VSLHVFSTSALVAGELSASRPCRFNPRERAPSIHWIEGRVGPRAGLDDVEKRIFLTLSGLELRPLGHPARSWSLYRLRYPGSFLVSVGWYFAIYTRRSKFNSFLPSTQLHVVFANANMLETSVSRGILRAQEVKKYR
jgi:hypothetical protein